MRKRRGLLTLGVLLLAPVLAVQGGSLKTGEVPPVVRIEGDRGGRTDKTAWSSSEIKGKLFVLFYVDPDEQDMNEAAAEAIQNEAFPDATFGSIAVVNTAATWKPDWIIGKILDSKQKKYPRTVYVLDRASVLVKEWGLKDDSYAVLVFDPEGRLRFLGDGRLSDARIKELIATIKTHLPVAGK